MVVMGTTLKATALLACGLSTLFGCRRAPTEDALTRPAEASIAGSSAPAVAGSAARDSDAASFASLSTAPAHPAANVRLSAVSPRAATDDLTRAPLADATIALRGAREDGTALISFRRGRSFYELSSPRVEGAMVWLRAIDPEAADGAPPLALIGLSIGALEATQGAPPGARIALDRRAPQRGRAALVARVVDRDGAPRAGVRIATSAGDVRIDDARGELVPGARTGPRGVAVLDDVDPASGGVELGLFAPAGANGPERTERVRARVEADVTTSVVIELQ